MCDVTSHARAACLSTVESESDVSKYVERHWRTYLFDGFEEESLVDGSIFAVLVVVMTTLAA